MRIALISDIHANLPSLESVLASIGDAAGVDATYHVGDLCPESSSAESFMDRWYDRRTFLRRMGAAGLFLQGARLSGCTPPRPEEARAVDEAADHDPASGATRVERPVLIPWGDDVIHIDAPAPGPPVAYVSMAHRRVYVDHENRERVHWLLGAHISVSTDLWRIPLRGESGRVPIMPGDVTREFEEIRMGEWDPTERSMENDIRVSLGRPGRVRIELTCAPISGNRRWLSGPAIEVWRCGGGEGEACREDLVTVGHGWVHRDRACRAAQVPIRCVAWACRPV